MLAEKRWNHMEQGSVEVSEHLAMELRIPKVLSQLLVQRGITSSEEANRFFNPSLSELHNPFLMKDMDKAVARISTAIETGESIMVYGDYDVDGTTAVALVYTYLESLGHKALSFYIPDRYTEGYGISEQGIEFAQTKGVTLIIALDCGIKAVEGVNYAKSLGIDFIICDHHLPGEEIPHAVAVLDAKREDCTYPFDELSGCGVGFKLVQAYAMHFGLDMKKVYSLLDFVVVSIASDIVPLIGENRVLAHFGLDVLNNNPSKGLHSILKICSLEKHTITIDDIVFKVGPRINAAGRMIVEDDDGEKISGGRNAVRLLISNTDEIALKYGNIIDECNSGRKEIDRNITIEAHKIVEKNNITRTRKCTVIYDPTWMKGVVGIVASRLIERYYRPTVVLTMSNGFITGSARSVPGFDLYQAIESCSDLLENFGGHTYAAGLTMKPENLDAFKKRFAEYVEEHIEPQMLIPQIDIDMYLDLSEITTEFRKTLCKFQPFGPGNPAPIFVTQNVCDDGHGRKVGINMEHLKMDVISSKNHLPISAIAFSQANAYADHVLKGGYIDICYMVVENNYRGEVKPQLRIKDIKIKNK
ncbi:MAG: single-stranded-DNA-specific exonuclease RecJ [Rikenellaceae bacterium]